MPSGCSLDKSRTIVVFASSAGATSVSSNVGSTSFLAVRAFGCEEAFSGVFCCCPFQDDKVIMEWHSQNIYSVNFLLTCSDLVRKRPAPARRATIWPPCQSRRRIENEGSRIPAVQRSSRKTD